MYLVADEADGSSSISVPYGSPSALEIVAPTPVSPLLSEMEQMWVII